MPGTRKPAMSGRAHGRPATGNPAARASAKRPESSSPPSAPSYAKKTKSEIISELQGLKRQNSRLKKQLETARAGAGDAGSRKDDELAYSQRFLKSIIDNEPECVKMIERDGTLIDMNPSGLAMIEAEGIEQVRGQSVLGIVAPEHRREFARLTEEVCGGASGIMQFRIVGLKGAQRWLETHAVPFFDEKRGRNVLLSVTRDITGQKEYEARLARALKDKEFLVREVNHRVKNNLAVLQSLVSLQTHLIKDPVAKGYLENVSNRIRTLSLIHEKLYRADNAKSIEMGDYISTLCSQIYRSLVIDESSVRLALDVPEVVLDVEYVIPCGLIINELLTNALKYAFPLNSKGEVRISFRPAGDGRFRLCIADTGRGLPGGFDMDSAPGLGMKIVRSLVEQIKGELEVKGNGGAEFSVTFAPEAQG